MKRFGPLVFIGVALLLPLSAGAYSYAGYRWGGNFPVVGVDSSGLMLSSWRTAALDAMNSWNSAGAKFGLLNQQGSGNTMGYYYDANTPALAYATIYRSFWTGNITKATIMVNNYWNYNPPYSGGTWYDLRTVLRHEFGHWLKLNHSPVASAVMYDSIGSKSIKFVGGDDMNGIRYIYGTR